MCTEKKKEGKAHKQAGTERVRESQRHGERKQWAAIRRRAPTAAKLWIPTHTHMHEQMCVHIHTYILIQSFYFPHSVTHTHTHLHIHFSSWYALWPGLLKRGQLSRCSATAFTIGTSNWWRHNRKRSTNVLHSSCTVESARWATHNTCFILGSFESALIHCVKQCGGIRLYISAVSSNWVKKKKTIVCLSFFCPTFWED